MEFIEAGLTPKFKKGLLGIEEPLVQERVPNGINNLDLVLNALSTFIENKLEQHTPLIPSF